MQDPTDPLANAGDLEQLLYILGKGGYLLWISFERFGGIAVRADAKGVIPIDLHQIGGLVKNTGDGFVIHSPTKKIVTWADALNGFDPALASEPNKKPSHPRLGDAAMRRVYWVFTTFAA